MHLDFTDGSSADITAVDRQNLKISQRQQNSSGRITSKRNTLFDYTIYEEESICYLQFNQFADRLTHPQYTQLARFDEFTRDMMAEIKAKGIKTLVVDLQYNSGGNSQLGDVLLSWLYPHQETRQYDVDVRVSELLCTFYPYYRKFTVGGKPLKIGQIYDYMGFDHSKDYQTDYSAPQDPAKHIFNYDGEQIFGGNVVFIQSKDSFSSTILLLTSARDNGIGIIVGEPSGGKPCHYGDVLYAQLPNTNTLATVSHKYFRRPNMALENKECIVPDVSIELNHPERDLVWEWIVENYGKRRE
jgi:C-terminal processing protease CtpA/Prc